MPNLFHTKLIAAVALLLGMASSAAQDLGGDWKLRILDPQKQLKAAATLRFTDDAAHACMRGKWKRVIVDSKEGPDPAFFPLDAPLAYKLDRGVLTMGRVDTCKRYIFLSATAAERDIHGTYKAVSVGRSRQLGLFTLRAQP